MKKRNLVVAVVAAFSFGWIAQASAQPEGGPRMRRPGGPEGQGPSFERRGPGGPPGDMLAEQLGLSDDQRTQWKAIQEKQMETSRPLFKAAGEAGAAFEKALESDNPDAVAIGRAAIAMRETRRAAEESHKASFEQLKAILTPEQQTKLAEMEKHRDRRGSGEFGPGGGPGGPGGPRRRPGGPGGSN